MGGGPLGEDSLADFNFLPAVMEDSRPAREGAGGPPGGPGGGGGDVEAG